MKVKFSELRRVMEHMRYNVYGDDESLVDLSIKEEDISANNLISSFVMSISADKDASSYDSLQSPKTVTTSIEMFSHHENKPSVMTVTESRLLTKKTT